MYRPAEPNVHILLSEEVHIRVCRSVGHVSNIAILCENVFIFS